MIQFDKKILFLFLGRLIQALLAIVAIRVMTQLLLPVEIGNQYVINSIVLWFSLVLVNPMGMYINRHLNEWKKNNQIYFYLKKINYYFVLIALLSLPIIFVAKQFFDVARLIPQFDLFIFILIYLYVSTWFQTLVSFFNLLDFQKTFVVLNIIAQAMGLLTAYVLISAIRPDAIGWLSGLLFGQGVSLLAAVFLFKKYIPKQDQQTISQDHLLSSATFLFCYPIAITTIFMWFLNQGYRLIIEKNLGAEILAPIGIGLGLAASLAGVVESITTQYLYPKYYSELPGSNFEKRKAAWSLLWQKSITIYILTAFTMLACSRFVVDVLVAQKFQHLVWYFAVGVGIEFLKQNSNIIYLAAHGEKQTQKNILPYLFGALVLFIGFKILIYKNLFLIDELLGVLLLSHLVTYIYNVIHVKKMLQHSFNKKIVFRALILGLPLLAVYFLVPAELSIFIYFALAILSGLWGLGSIYVLDQKMNKN